MQDKPAVRKVRMVGIHGNTRTDIAANRKGRLSKRQSRRLLRGFRGSVLVMLLLIAIPVIGIALDNSVDTNVCSMLCVGVLMTLSVISSVYYPRVYPIWKDYRAGVVFRVGGHAHRLSSSERDDDTDYMLAIGGIEFAVDATIYNRVEENRRYTAYYTPNAHHLVSLIEHM